MYFLACCTITFLIEGLKFQNVTARARAALPNVEYVHMNIYDDEKDGKYNRSGTGVAPLAAQAAAQGPP